MTKRDYYEILGVQRNAEISIIKKEYRKLALQYHPDRNPGDSAAEEKFKEAAEAYEVLSNPDKRARYDRFGHAGVQDNGGFSGGSGGMSMDDIFSHFGDIFGNAGGPFDSFFGGSSRSSQSAGGGERGSNIRIKINLSLEEIAEGTTKKIKLKKDITCDQCNGSGAKDASSITTCPTCKGSGYVRQVRSTFLGQMATTSPCPTCSGSGKKITSFCQKCKGSGVMNGDETLEINIPAGVEDGMQLSMRGKGNAGKHNGQNGDLIINIEEKQHDDFTRDGQNIVYETNLNFADLVMGTEIVVPTLSGKLKFKIPSGTPAGKIFRLKGKGIQGLHSYDKGDQLVHVNVWIPKKISNEEKQLMDSLKNSQNFEPGENSKGKGFFERMKEYFE
ncbi:MAG: molecular chaperone DnaJ [Saprospiraceae bacterium]